MENQDKLMETYITEYKDKEDRNMCGPIIFATDFKTAESKLSEIRERDKIDYKLTGRLNTEVYDATEKEPTNIEESGT